MADIFDRLHAALKVLVRESIPDLTFAGIWSYTVKNFHEGEQTADLSPANNQALPFLEKVPIRLPGLQVKLSPDDSVLVGFADRDPTKPFVAHLNFASTYTTALAISRQGDMVSIPVNLVPAMAGQPPVPVPNAYSIFLAPPPPPPFTPLSGGPASLYGVVSSGSTQNKSK